MNFRPKKIIRVEFVVPGCVNVRLLGDLEAFLREHTNEVTVEDLVESCCLSEVPQKVPKKSIRTPVQQTCEKPY